jgi:hypothetical protein
MHAFVLKRIDADRCMVLMLENDCHRPLLEVGRMVADALDRNGIILWQGRHQGVVGKPGIVLIDDGAEVDIQIRADVGDPTTVISGTRGPTDLVRSAITEGETSEIHWLRTEDHE